MVAIFLYAVSNKFSKCHITASTDIFGQPNIFIQAFGVSLYTYWEIDNLQVSLKCLIEPVIRCFWNSNIVLIKMSSSVGTIIFKFPVWTILWLIPIFTVFAFFYYFARDLSTTFKSVSMCEHVGNLWLIVFAFQVFSVACIVRYYVKRNFMVLAAYIAPVYDLRIMHTF